MALVAILCRLSGKLKTPGQSEYPGANYQADGEVTARPFIGMASVIACSESKERDMKIREGDEISKWRVEEREPNDWCVTLIVNYASGVITRQIFVTDWFYRELDESTFIHTMNPEHRNQSCIRYARDGSGHKLWIEPGMSLKAVVVSEMESHLAGIP